MLTIVKYGRPPGMHRVGVVIGQYTDADLGEMVCVRTPYNIIAGQRFDAVPADKIEPATIEELRENAAREIDAAHTRVTEFVAAVQL